MYLIKFVDVTHIDAASYLKLSFKIRKHITSSGKTDQDVKYDIADDPETGTTSKSRGTD